MIIDTSAIMAFLLDEPDSQIFLAAMRQADERAISAGSAVELAVVCSRLAPPISQAVYGRVLKDLEIDVAPVDEVQMRAAWEGYARFGRGRHPAGLNFGDCFAYALAITSGRPLLFKGRDFAATDVRPALRPG